MSCTCSQNSNARVTRWQVMQCIPGSIRRNALAHVITAGIRFMEPKKKERRRRWLNQTELLWRQQRLHQNEKPKKRNEKSSHSSQAHVVFEPFLTVLIWMHRKRDECTTYSIWLTWIWTYYRRSEYHYVNAPSGPNWICVGAGRSGERVCHVVCQHDLLFTFGCKSFVNQLPVCIWVETFFLVFAITEMILSPAGRQYLTLSAPSTASFTSHCRAGDVMSA